MKASTCAAPAECSVCDHGIGVQCKFILPLTFGKRSVEQRKCSVLPPPDQRSTCITHCANLLTHSVQAALQPHMHREVVHVLYVQPLTPSLQL